MSDRPKNVEFERRLEKLGDDLLDGIYTAERATNATADEVRRGIRMWFSDVFDMYVEYLEDNE